MTVIYSFLGKQSFNFYVNINCGFLNFIRIFFLFLLQRQSEFKSLRFQIGNKTEALNLIVSYHVFQTARLFGNMLRQ